MQIVLVAGGSRGDVQPYVALGQGLRKAGHGVRVLATNDFQELVTAYGLEFVSMGGGADLVAQFGMEDIIERGNLLEILASTGRGAQQLAHDSAIGGRTACQGSDLIITGLGGLFVGLALSEKFNLPLVQAHLMPSSPTSRFASPILPLPPIPLPRWANRLTHSLARQLMWQMFRSADNQVRTQDLHLQPSPFTGPFAALEHRTRCILYGFSPHVIPPPPDWPNSIHVTGYWFLDPPAGWQPPDDLTAFLQAGSTPVYIGFGSMPSRKPEETADLVLQALARTGQRGMLSSGWGGLRRESLPENVFMVGSIPHTWLFPKMAAVVHHGGAGTTAAGLRAGVPSVLTPFFGDQPFWGDRVFRLGVGPKPIPRQRLSVDRLADAIQTAVSDSGMRNRAAALGERIRAEAGVAEAVSTIERSLAVV